jgi:hypothetical protein
MHSPINIIAVNEITRDRLAEAHTARLARQGKAAAPKRSSFRFQGVELLRRVRLA